MGSGSDAISVRPHAAELQAKQIHVDVEFGHHTLYSMHSDVRIEEVQLSAEIAQQLIAGLSSHGIAAKTSLLVDDKRCKCTCGIDCHLAEFLQYTKGLPLDQVMLESDLASLWETVLDQICFEKREHVRGRVGRWSARHNGLSACSQDIAIWHSLRMGLIDSSAAEWLRRPIGNLPAAEPDHVFCASILPRRFKAFEDLARKDILSWMADFSSDSLYQLYFDLSDTEKNWQSAVRLIIERIEQIAGERRLREDASHRVNEIRLFPEPVDPSSGAAPVDVVAHAKLASPSAAIT